jgi:cell wall-associated NlpC family hydrolase
VEKGETLSSIAELYGMSVRELKALNHIRRPRRLRAGAQILVNKPSASGLRETKTASPATEAAAPAPPATVTPDSRLARELKELADTPVVKEVRELSTPPAGGSGTAGIKEKLIEIAHTMLDIPYRFGGSSLLGIDCSGYVQKVFGLLDIVLPRTAREQFRLGKLVGKEDLSIGDLVFFRTYAKFPSHVGIYLGDNRFIHASSTDRKVKIDSLDAPDYIKRFVGARRLPLDEPADEI